MDLIAVPGQVVVAPCACWVVRVVRPYGNGALYDVGVVLEGREAEWNYVQFRLFYVDPSYSLVMAHHPRRAGEPLGIAVSLDSRYRGITEHVHFEVIKDGALLDPTPLLFPGGASA